MTGLVLALCGLDLGCWVVTGCSTTHVPLGLVLAWGLTGIAAVMAASLDREEDE